MANKTTLDETLRSPVDGTEQVRLATSGANWRAPLSAIVGMMYYVDGSAGNDSNSGALSAPWKTITKVNASTFKPGDAVLFRGGQTFNGAIVSPTAGTPATPITFGSYGGGRATISSSTSNGFTSTNQDGIIVRDLIFTGSASTNIGIYFNITSTALPQNIQAINCKVSGYGNSGILVWSTTAGFYTDVLLQDCVADNCCSIASAGAIGSAGIWAGYNHANVRAINCTASNNAGATDTVNTGNGIKFSQISGGAISKCFSFSNGASANNTNANGGSGGIVVIYSTGVVVSECEAYLNSTATSLGGGVLQDGNGIDIDGGCTNCHAIGNYTHDNYGAGLILYAFASAGPSDSNSIRNSVSVNDGTGGALSNIPFSIFLGRDTGTTHLTNSVISGNVVWQSNANAAVLNIGSAGANTNFNFDINGNIFSISGAQKFVNCADNPANGSLKGNTYNSAGAFAISWNGTTYGTTYDWFAATGQEGYEWPSVIGALTVRNSSNPSVNFVDDHTGSGWQLGGYHTGATPYFYLSEFSSGNTDLAVNFDAHGSTQLRSGSVFGWSSDATGADNATMDAGISRNGGAAKIAAGNGTPGNASAEFDARIIHLITSNNEQSFIVDNSAFPVAFNLRGTTNGSHISDYSLSELSSGKQWTQSFRDDNSFLLFYFDGVSTFQNSIRVTKLGSVIANSSGALATTATDGDLYIPTCAGTPTGTPTTQTGSVPLRYDTTNNQLWIYAGGAWKQPKTPAGAAIVNWQ